MLMHVHVRVHDNLHAIIMKAACLAKAIVCTKSIFMLVHKTAVLVHVFFLCFFSQQQSVGVAALHTKRGRGDGAHTARPQATA